MSVNIENKGSVLLSTRENAEGHIIEIFPSKKYDTPLYSAAPITLAKGAAARIWFSGKNKLQVSMDSPQIIKMPDDANAVVVFMTMYYLASGADSQPYANNDRLDLWGYEESTDGTKLNPCCRVSGKLLRGSAEYQESAFAASPAVAYREVTVESVVYKEFPMPPIILPSCGFRHVAPFFIGTERDDDVIAGNIHFIKMWYVPVFMNYIGEGLF